MHVKSECAKPVYNIKWFLVTTEKPEENHHFLFLRKHDREKGETGINSQ